MKKNLSLVLILTLVLSVFNFNLNAYANQTYSYSIDDLKTKASEQANTIINNYKTQSIQYALIDNGEIVVEGSSGAYSRNENKAISPDTMYSIGSVSKMFVTTAVMKLVDMGKIKLDTPVYEYLPEFKMADERYKDITVRMLLNHSSGLLGSSLKNAFLFEDRDTYYKDNLLNILSAQRLKSKPGEFAVYCNDGFSLAELVVEKVSGLNFTEFIHTYITKPLELENTKTPLDEFDRIKLAKTYDTSNSELPAETLNAIGTGGIYSTATDLVKFAQIFINNDILSESSIKEMENEKYATEIYLADGDTISSFGAGLGWDCVKTYPFTEYNIKALVKGGDTSLSCSSLIVLPEYNLAAAVASSGGSSIYNEALASDMLLNILKSKGIISEIKPAKSYGVPVQATVPEDLKKYTGFYATMNMMLKIDIDDTSLKLAVPLISDKVQTYSYSDDGYFKRADGKERLKFVEEKNGKVYLLDYVYTDIPNLPQLASMSYYAERVEPVELSESVLSAWNSRDNQSYFILNEKYTSQLYLSLNNMIVGLIAPAEPLGYMNTYKVIDENNLQAQPAIMRDLQDIQMFNQNEKEYLKASGGYIAIKADGNINNIASSEKSVCTIKEDGYTIWFTVGEDTKGKVMNVEIPEKGSFAVYDSAGLCVNYSIVSKNNTVTLPENGYIAFMGEALQKFNIEITKAN